MTDFAKTFVAALTGSIFFALNSTAA